MARLTLSLLGGFAAAVDGTPVQGFDTDKTRALLAYLGIEAAQAHSREALADLLWPQLPGDAARRNLRNSLFKLRQALGEDETQPGFLLVTAKTVQLDPQADWEVDVNAFTGLFAACRTHRHRHPEHCTTCHARLEQAAVLYRGDLLRGFHLGDCAAFEEWLILTRERLHHAVLQVLAQLATYHAGRAEVASALEYTLRQLALEPWREDATRQAMRLLAVSGDRNAALAQYAACRKVLAEELNAEPSAETTALYEQLKTPALPAAPALPAPSGHLPRSLTPFIGREAELRLLIERLDSPDYPLLTILGPGGAGKTRLALQAAEAQGGAFRDGVYWVALAAVGTADLLAASIAQALKLQFGAATDPAAQLVRYLHDKELLLVLDNFEQLLTGGAATDLLLSILRGAPQICLLVTSRVRLGLQAEYLLDLTGLALPPEPETGGRGAGPGLAGDTQLTPEGLLASSAVQLFMERAQLASPAFALSPETAPGVVEICRLVAGLPLGIVLAAAWVRHLPPARIAASIRANLDFLTSAARDVAPQHSSLRAVFQHSWLLLTADEQRVLRRLAVFRGGWDEEAAGQVAGANLPVLVSLVDKSLLRQDRAGRFDIHEVLRQYAAEQLDEGPQERADVTHRHAAYYLELAEAAEGGLRGGEQAEWLARLEREHDNLRAALRWATETSALEIGLRLAGALWRFWYVRGYFSEGRAQLDAVLAIEGATGGPPSDGMPSSAGGGATTQPDHAHSATILAAKAKALNGAGALAILQGATHAGRIFYEQSLAIRRALGDTRGVAVSLNNLGLLAHEQGDYAAARALHEESLALRRELGDQGGLASSLNNLGIVAYQQGDYAAARALYQESLALRRELGDKQGIALLLDNLGIVAHSSGDYETARAQHEESLALMRELGNQHGVAGALTGLGIVAHNQAQYDAARAWHEESLALSKELGDTGRIALSLHNLGVVAQMRGENATAGALYRESLALQREVGDKWGMAASLNSLGLLAQTEGDYASARALHRESLALRLELGEKRGIAACLAGLGGVAVGSAQGEPEGSPVRLPAQPGPVEWAAQLFGVVAAILAGIGGVLDIADRQAYEHHVAVVRGHLSSAAFADAWAAGQAMELEQAIRAALA
jgi:predicted ATPase/DNA-binding SARP family transcriptional activator/Tfp pilus assembly protein PilF